MSKGCKLTHSIACSTLVELHCNITSLNLSLWILQLFPCSLELLYPTDHWPDLHHIAINHALLTLFGPEAKTRCR